jgi:hypothetical protein
MGEDAALECVKCIKGERMRSQTIQRAQWRMATLPAGVGAVGTCRAAEPAIPSRLTLRRARRPRGSRTLSVDAALSELLVRTGCHRSQAIWVRISLIKQRKLIYEHEASARKRCIQAE